MCRHRVVFVYVDKPPYVEVEGVDVVSVDGVEWPVDCGFVVVVGGRELAERWGVGYLREEEAMAILSLLRRWVSVGDGARVAVCCRDELDLNILKRSNVVVVRPPFTKPLGVGVSEFYVAPWWRHLLAELKNLRQIESAAYSLVEELLSSLDGGIELVVLEGDRISPESTCCSPEVQKETFWRAFLSLALTRFSRVLLVFNRHSVECKMRHVFKV